MQLTGTALFIANFRFNTETSVHVDLTKSSTHQMLFVLLLLL